MALRSKSNRRAFSLPELVVGMAVLSIGVISAMQALSFSARMSGLVADMAGSAFILQDAAQSIEYKESRNLVETNVIDTIEPVGDYLLEIKKGSGTPFGQVTIYDMTFSVGWPKDAIKERLTIKTSYIDR